MTELLNTVGKQRKDITVNLPIFFRTESLYKHPYKLTESLSKYLRKDLQIFLGDQEVSIT